MYIGVCVYTYSMYSVYLSMYLHHARPVSTTLIVLNEYGPCCAVANLNHWQCKVVAA